MKKIGLITLYEANNYGTCLQAYSVQNRIKKLGYDCEIIKRPNTEDVKKKSLLFKVKETVKNIGIVNGLKIVASRPYIKKVKQDFDEFRKEFLTVCDKRYTFEELEKIQNKYDAYVCGSDMLWAGEYPKHLSFYFLDFAPKEKRIAYSPSFGSATITEERMAQYISYINGIKYLSCREQSGVNMIRELTKREAPLAADPTLLLSAEEWRENMGVVNDETQYILSYMFSERDKDVRRIMGRLKKDMNCKIRYIPMRYSEYVSESKHGNGKYGPKQYVQLYANAKFVVADGYHGLLFALIFKKPFVLLHRGKKEYWGKYEDRMMSLLKTLGLEERYLERSGMIEERMFSLDYSKIEPILDGIIEKSKKYLEDSLKNAVL